MKKTFYLLLAAVVSLAMQGCEKIESLFSIDKSVTVNVVVDTSVLPNASGLRVQTMSESVAYDAESTCTVKIFDNTKPQIIAVTDAEDNLLMLYRGAVSEGAVVHVNTLSTARALVTFNPLYGPIPASDLASLYTVIESASNYQPYREAVLDAVSRGMDLTSSQNTQLYAMLHNLLRELTEQAFAGQESLEAAAVNANSFLNCYPLIAESSNGNLTLRTTGNCPSYYGEVIDADGNKLQDVTVTAAGRYAFMDNFSGTAANNSYGTPVTVPFSESGSYTIRLSCTEESAIVDFYIRLVNNILTTLGADISPVMVSALTPLVRRVVDESGVDIVNISTEEVMGVVLNAYDAVVDYLRGQTDFFDGEGNWNLASDLLKRQLYAYNGLRSTTDALLRTSYGFVPGEEEEPGHESEGVNVEAGASRIIIRVTYCPGTDGLPGALVPQEGVDIAMLSGNNQVAKAFHTLANPLRVKVRTFDGEGNTVVAAGRTVRFVVASGGGQLSQTSVLTSAEGIAATHWTLGSGTSGATQKVYAVVVDEQGNEVSARVYFNALIANDRYLVSLCCDWTSPDNYASRFVMDFAPVRNTSGVVDLYPSVGQAWGNQNDYNGLAESIEMSGTFNNTTGEVVLDVAMYLVDTRFVAPGERIHFRTDRYQFIYNEDESFKVQGDLIWDGFIHGNGQWGAGCATYTFFKHFNDHDEMPATAPYAGTKSRLPEGRKAMVCRVADQF
ncbi:MAG: hypothetical protein J6I49_08680 [Bacteroidales bacterium]|nr:hypothetical protein [Bacteroidales bacterium]